MLSPLVPHGLVVPLNAFKDFVFTIALSVMYGPSYCGTLLITYVRMIMLVSSSLCCRNSS
jgi:hypothetical protein